MRNIELEEGEAFFLQDDDDENIDPDRDFSYIDHKLENVLGHHQKDFLRRFSAKCLGPRSGDYGSFLPMYERSPPLLPNQRSQSHVGSKYPFNLPSKVPNHFSGNPTVTAHTAVSAKPVPVSGAQAGKHTLEPGVSTVNSQPKVKSSAECASTQQQQLNKPIIQHSEQNSLKFKVKMPSEGVLSRDNTAIYSGLGLDMSPNSSPEGTPIVFDRTLPDFPEMKHESPSFIIKVMTSISLPNDDALISPLHDDLICLMKGGETLETIIPGIVQAESLNIIQDYSYLDGKKEACDERKAKHKDTRKERNLKQKEASEERKSKQNIKKQKFAELVKEDDEFPANSSDVSAIRREEIETLVDKKIASNNVINAVDVRSKETGKSSDSRPSLVLDEKTEVGRVVEEMPVPKHKVKEEFALVFSDATMVDEGNSGKIRSKSEKGENKISIPKVEPCTDKRNVLRLGEDGTNKFVKRAVKDIVKDEEFESVCPKEADGYRKESGKKENNSKEELSLVSGKEVKDNNKKHVDIHLEMKRHDSEDFESSKKKSYINEMPHLKMGLSLEEPSSSLLKKKLKDSQSIIVSSNELLRESIVSSNGPEGQTVIRKNISSKSKKSNPKETRKGSEVTAIENRSKRDKEVSSREIVMGLSERDVQPSTSKMNEQLSSKNTGVITTGPDLEGDRVGGNFLRESSKNTGVITTGPNLEGDRVGGNFSRERVPVGEFPQPGDSLVPLEMDDWVQCEKCQKWRLLPFGTNPDSLAKEWICSMLTWLPGMNKCSVSEDETTYKLRALYIPSAVGPVLQAQHNQQAHTDGIAGVKASSGAQNAGLSNLPTSTDVLLNSSNKKNQTKLEIDAIRQSGARDVHRPIKKDQEHSGGIRNSKNLTKNQLGTAFASKCAEGAGRPSKIPKKRTSEAMVSGVSKKVKNVHRSSIESSAVAGVLPPKVKGGSQNDNPDAFQTSHKFGPGSSERLPLKVKKRGRSVMTTMDDEVNDVSEKRRKMKNDRQKPAEPFGNGQLPLNNPVTGKNSVIEPRKERETNTSNIDAREGSEVRGHHRIKGNVRKHNLGRADDNDQHKGSRVGSSTREQYSTDRISRKTAGTKKSSENVLDLGLSDNATTSSSSKISSKVKAKACKVKCSPVGSISSSPFKVCKSDPDTGTNKFVVSYSEPEESSSRKRLKFRAEGASASHEFSPHNEEIKDRKSNLSRISGAMSDGSAHRIDSQPKQDELERHDGSLDHRHHDRITVASQWNPDNRMPSVSHFDGSSSNRPKLCVPEMGGEKESSVYANCLSDFEKGSGSNSVRVDNGKLKLSKHVLDDHVSLKHHHHTAHSSKDIAASSSKQNDTFHTAAKTALKEAKDLKHSANRLKTAGSGLSTGIFFQAALKFLHGASLLEPETTENGRIEEMLSTEVYRSTAKLCEYCAHEYEKCHDMASAALAYKCMEVAYMRVVYDNDVAASRDRVEVQMAVRAAPQVESPSSSASDIDNLNNQVAIDSVRDVHCVLDHRNHVISARNRPNFVRLLNFTHDINLAMEASKRSQSAFAVANPVLSQAGNEEGISSIKKVLDFSFHDVDSLLHLVYNLPCTAVSVFQSTCWKNMYHRNCLQYSTDKDKDCSSNRPQITKVLSLGAEKINGSISGQKMNLPRGLFCPYSKLILPLIILIEVHKNKLQFFSRIRCPYLNILFDRFSIIGL